jgi:hypothetical protein
VVRNPVIWAISPGVGDTSWSTDTTWQGRVGFSFPFPSLDSLPCHGFFVAFEYRHAEHVGIRHLARRLGMIPCFAISCNFRMEIWPYCWWSINNSARSDGCLSSLSELLMLTVDVGDAALSPSKAGVVGPSRLNSTGVAFSLKVGSTDVGASFVGSMLRSSSSPSSVPELDASLSSSLLGLRSVSEQSDGTVPQTNGTEQLGRNNKVGPNYFPRIYAG